VNIVGGIHQRIVIVMPLLGQQLGRGEL